MAGLFFFRPWFAILCGCLCMIGCSSGPYVPTGEVAGTVTFRGKPVQEGVVTFQNEEAGFGDEATLDAEGRFAVKKPIPTGDYKIVVHPPIELVREDGKGPEVGVPKRMPDIPERYRLISTTDLRAAVKEGKNTFNFDMKP